MINIAVRKQILIADSDVSYLKKLLNLLENHNFDTLTANSEQGTIQKAESLDIDLILLGENMPDASGLDVCRHLKTNPRTEHIPVVILTGPKSEQKVKGYHLGADECIDRDFEQEEFFARIESLWRRRNGAYRHFREERQKQVVNELTRIIDNELIQPHFQPIYFIKPFRLLGFEVLSRPVGGSIISNADELFKSAIKYDMYYPLEMLCWRKAAEIVSARTRNEHVFFNCSPYMVENQKFPNVKRIFEKNQIPFNKVVLELTERSSVSEYQVFYNRLHEFRANGFSFAVDDVGGGYASLESIVATKPEIVKIDAHIVQNLQKDSVKRSIVKFIAAFCKENNIVSIAEGVEQKEEMDAVTELGIDAVQGYYLFKPTPDLNVREMKDLCVAFV
nr:diguanylate cyclase/phosphodiesterase (GGDEF &EAL domains) response regulator (CheY-like) [uncultured bacterium]